MNHSLSQEYLENHTFDEIHIGDTASLVRTLTMEDINLFAVMAGDRNPTIIDEDYAKTDRYHEVVAPGMWGGALITTVLGNKYPGPGTISVSQTFRFVRPVTLGDTITVSVRVTGKNPENKHIEFDCECVNQEGTTVIAGTAVVLAPASKVRRTSKALPDVQISDPRAGYKHLLKLAEGLPPIRTAVVHPTDKESLQGAVEAAEENLIDPILIGPEAKIRALAAELNLDISRFELVATEHSHAAAEKGVQLCRSGQADVLMKGSLHTDELMAEVVRKETGLRSGRRISHVFVMDVPTYPRHLFITDAAINIAPTLDEKRDIIQSAVDLAHALDVAEPRVAVLCAVETVNSGMNCTLDAAALCKMADRGQITGCIVDGPLAFDNAVSEVAAKTKGITSRVAGKADILVVPDLEAGNMLAKQLSYLANAEAAGVVLGARVPIVLTSRADNAQTRRASCAVAVLLAAHNKKKKNGAGSV